MSTITWHVFLLEQEWLTSKMFPGFLWFQKGLTLRVTLGLFNAKFCSLLSLGQGMLTQTCLISLVLVNEARGLLGQLHQSKAGSSQVQTNSNKAHNCRS